MDIKYRIGRAYDPAKWNCAHCVADYFQQHAGVDVLPSEPGAEWDKQFLYWMRRYFKSRGPFIGDWSSHVGEMITCRTFSGQLHVGIATPQGIYHAYSGTRTSGGDTVITDYNMFMYKDVRFFEWSV